MEVLTMMKFTAAALSASALVAGCAGYENTTRDAAVGGAVGAAVGGAVGNNVGDGDATTGALIGGAVGAAAGAARGCREDNVCPWNDNDDAHSDLRYDRSAGRYYYFNEGNNCTYWRNGEFRGC
ncbi:MAG: glycine zipper domain-containing protein [Oceanicaulis sp.]